MQNLINRFVREEEGQDLIEYGLLIGIITLACIVAVKSIGGKLGAYFEAVDDLLT